VQGVAHSSDAFLVNSRATFAQPMTSALIGCLSVRAC
jgi:hypothetical protein